jgi:GNAT superfamily N-acetyltransferase
MLVAADDGLIVGGAHIGPRGALSIALAPEARGQGLGRRLAITLEDAATRLGLRAINVGGVIDDTRAGRVGPYRRADADRRGRAAGQADENGRRGGAG